MNNSHKALWEECLHLIEANVSEQQYKTWFAPIVFESYSETEQTLLVQVPSPYVYEYLEQYYVGLLSKVLARVFGTSVKLSYRIVTVKAQHNVTTTVESDGPSDIQQPQGTNKAPTTLDAATPQQLNPQLDARPLHRRASGQEHVQSLLYLWSLGLWQDPPDQRHWCALQGDLSPEAGALCVCPSVPGAVHRLGAS